MAFTRHATARWQGSSSEGSGTLATGSGALDGTPYTFAGRFVSEDGRDGTNPEELIAAAHAGCFTMALSVGLTRAGHPPAELATSAQVTIERGEFGFSITGIALDVTGRVPGLDAARFAELAEGAKNNCPVSKALKAVPVTLSATLAE